MLLDSIQRKRKQAELAQHQQDAFLQLANQQRCDEDGNTNTAPLTDVDDLACVYERLSVRPPPSSSSSSSSSSSGESIPTSTNQHDTTNKLGAWCGIMDSLCARVEQRVRDMRVMMRVPTRQSLAQEVNLHQTVCAGDMRVRRIRDVLNTMAKVRSPDQKVFHEAMIIANLPHIYFENWEANSKRVMEEFGIARIRQELLSIMPRRMGKSWCVAMFIAAMLICVPGRKQAVFSTGGRASGWLKDLVLKMIDKVTGASARIARRSKETIFMAAHDVSSARKHNKSRAKLLGDAEVSEAYFLPSAVAGQFSHAHT